VPHERLEKDGQKKLIKSAARERLTHERNAFRGGRRGTEARYKRVREKEEKADRRIFTGKEQGPFWIGEEVGAAKKEVVFLVRAKKKGRGRRRGGKSEGIVVPGKGVVISDSSRWKGKFLGGKGELNCNPPFFVQGVWHLAQWVFVPLIRGRWDARGCCSLKVLRSWGAGCSRPHARNTGGSILNRAGETVKGICSRSRPKNEKERKVGCSEGRKKKKKGGGGVA